jgi:hypothetical protein
MNYNHLPAVCKEEYNENNEVRNEQEAVESKCGI